jgi:hypothetical protein
MPDPRGERQHQAGAAGEGALRLHGDAGQGRGRGLGHRLRAGGGAHHRPPRPRLLHHPAAIGLDRFWIVVVRL